MKCSYCGKEFEQGRIYCPHCGKTQQLVPDYFEAEEEILRDAGRKNLTADQKKSEKRQTKPTQRGRSEGRRKKRCRWILAAVIILVLVAAASFLIYQNRCSSSYDMQMQLARKAYENQNYDAAASHALNALTLDGASVDARILLYQSYDAQDSPDPTLLTEVLDLDPDNEEAYALLIAYYSDAGDYDTILDLAEHVPDDALLPLFEDVLTPSPQISPEGDTYEHNTEVEISSDYTVYYTTDGSVPDEDSEIYEEPILLESGTWTVTAAAVDGSGHWSLRVSCEYVIDPAAPGSVVISPSGGTYTSRISITLSADDGCTVYYGWDTTDLDDLTKEYTGSVSILEGNHILSAVAVSEDGIYGSVSSRSFIYLPDEEDTDE